MVILTAKKMKRRNFLLRCIAASSVIYAVIQTLYPLSKSNELRRNLSVVYESCSVDKVTLPTSPIIPIFAASYPGSGAQMVHYLYEALTGLEAGDEWYHRGDTYDRITIKTHFPARKHKISGSRLMNRVILLIRNPIFALPSHHNFIYEKENQIPNHTTRSPLPDWIRWRDLNFDKELGNWKKTVEFWVSNFDTDNRLIISYEHLINPKLGPVETTRINSFLARTDGVQTLPMSAIPCVWDKVVNYEKKNKKAPVDDKDIKKDENGQKRNMKYISLEDPTHPDRSRRSGPQIEYIFTASQLVKIQRMLNELRSKFVSDYTLVILLSEYIKAVDDKLKIAEKSAESN